MVPYRLIKRYGIVILSLFAPVGKSFFYIYNYGKNMYNCSRERMYGKYPRGIREYVRANPVDLRHGT